ncbi:MAG: cytochrome c biogenesis protein CcsA [Candidatus Hydrogenedentes bacterium]|nr:cytochrome c biogenesis protein CcsA [Candidatus Hydrogenedentota bacterium]
MTGATYIFFLFGVLLHVFGAALIARYLWDTKLTVLKVANTLAWGATACLIVALGVRWFQWQLLPLTGVTDAVSLLMIFSMGAATTVAWDTDRKAMLCFYLPPLATVGALTLLFSSRGLTSPPRELAGPLLVAHVGMVFLSMALLFVASLTSVAYTFQARRLKLRRTTGLFQKLPSLEELDRSLYQLIRMGYPIYVVTYLVGLFWAFYDNQLLSAAWWFSPKIVISGGILLFYAFSFHARARGLLRGPKLAYSVIFGVGLLLGTYLVLMMLEVVNYNFYGKPA